MKAIAIATAVLVVILCSVTPAPAQRGYGWAGYGFSSAPFGGYGYGGSGMGFSFSFGRGGYGYGYSPYSYGYGPYGYGYNPALGYPGGGYSYPYINPRYDYYPRGYYIPEYSYQRVAPTLSDASSLPSDQARLHIILPQANTELTFNGNVEPGAGKVRMFQPRGLEPGYKYWYKVGATWEQDGRPILDERTVDVVPGQLIVVDFTKPAVEKGPQGEKDSP